jgi:thiamine-monophosphate kinase
MSPADIGYRALAVNVSDVAAMGGASRFALLSLMLPPSMSVPDVDGLIDGLLDLAGALRITVAGGNITRSPGPLVVDVTVVGCVKPRRVVTRRGGQPGDWLYVTGWVGAAAAGLQWLQGHERGQLPENPELAECVTRYRRPEPRARIGAMLGRTRTASAGMDTSDGLADAIRQVSEAGGTGAAIDASAVPVHPGARRWFESRGQDPVAEAIGASDDYELLFSVSRRSRGRLRSVIQQSRGVRITRIGELTADRAVMLASAGRTEALPAGFVHF